MPGRTGLGVWTESSVKSLPSGVLSYRGVLRIFQMSVSVNKMFISKLNCTSIQSYRISDEVKSFPEVGTFLTNYFDHFISTWHNCQT